MCLYLHVTFCYFNFLERLLKCSGRTHAHMGRTCARGYKVNNQKHSFMYLFDLFTTSAGGHLWPPGKNFYWLPEGYSWTLSPSSQNACKLVGRSPMHPPHPCWGWGAVPEFHNQDQKHSVLPESKALLLMDKITRILIAAVHNQIQLPYFCLWCTHYVLSTLFPPLLKVEIKKLTHFTRRNHRSWWHSPTQTNQHVMKRQKCFYEQSRLCELSCNFVFWRIKESHGCPPFVSG